METHFVYAASFDDGYTNETKSDFLKSIIQERMKEYGITKIMLTLYNMGRFRLITNEKVESYCKGNEFEKDSVNDDLEAFFEDIQLGKKPHDDVDLYFLPKCTNKELKLIERKDHKFLKTFSWHDPDVPEAEMKLSESDSKYIFGECERWTYTIDL